MSGRPERMRFIGVSTSQSSIVRVFPRWAHTLNLHAELVGLDIPLHADAKAYRAAVAELRDDPRTRGALVTTHKIALFNAAQDLFTGLDEFAVACGEISSIKVKGDEVYGAARDPITAGKALEELLRPGIFDDGAEVLCMGAGGAGIAIGWYLSQRPEAPARMHFVDIDERRLRHLARVLAPRLHNVSVEVHLAADTDIAWLLKQVPDRSLIINATGMGKDIPGSPVPPDAQFPAESTIWELNYRGSLDFLAQARSQEGTRRLSVTDGWRYFIHGWSQVVADVFDLELTPSLVDRLAEDASDAR